MCERVWRTSALEREREGGRERTKEEGEREREKKEKEGEGEGSLSLFIHISFFSGQGTLHFISVFGRTMMTWLLSSFLFASSSHANTLLILTTKDVYLFKTFF